MSTVHVPSDRPVLQADAPKGFFELIMSGKASELFAERTRDKVDGILNYSAPARQEPRMIHRNPFQHQEMVDWRRTPLVPEVTEIE